MQEILRAWNVVPDSVTPISAKHKIAGSNLHWRIQSGADTFVLRAYRAEHTSATIDYETAVLRHLRGRRWPVAVPVGAPLWSEGRAFVLFPLLPGTPHTRETAEQMCARGRILGELHHHLTALVNVRGQRPGWQRANEVVARDQWQDIEHRLAAVQNAHQGIVRVIRQHAESLCNNLPSATRGFSITVAHGDLIAQNLLFQGSQLTGILDFDSTHLDFRAADIACARRGRHDDVVRGYLETSSLSDVELHCLGELWKANVFRYVLRLLHPAQADDLAASELAWCAKQLDETHPFEM